MPPEPKGVVAGAGMVSGKPAAEAEGAFKGIVGSLPGDASSRPGRENGTTRSRVTPTAGSLVGDGLSHSLDAYAVPDVPPISSRRVTPAGGRRRGVVTYSGARGAGRRPILPLTGAVGDVRSGCDGGRGWQM
jgi:hypothetical protein